MSLEKNLQIIYQSEPTLHFCERFDEKNSLWNFTRHSHPYIELIYYLSGKGRVKVPDGDLMFSPCDVTLYPSNLEHLDEEKGEETREIICFRVDLPRLEIPEPIRVHDSNETLKNLFLLIYEENKNKREFSSGLIQECALKTLLMEVLRSSEDSKSSYQLLDHAIEYIQNHFLEKITVEELASLEHVSESYLQRKFKQKTGYTVISYINNVRVEKAKNLLISTDFGIDEIAYQVGFGTPKYFYRIFKKMTGTSPSRFRRQFKI